MRPVNLIPPEQRRGRSAPARTGGVAPYLLLGLLGVILVGVTLVVLTGNTISERKAEITSLERQKAEAEARAQNLSSFVSVAQVRQARQATLASLAESRFDWERVMHELSLVLPSRVWLQNLRGTVSPAVAVGGSTVGLRSQIAGPALELVGCARSQRDVARLTAVLEDIDGVTRVAAQSSNKAGAGGSGGCGVRDFVASFQVVAGFDAVPVPAAAGAVPLTPAPPVASDSASPIAATGADGGVTALNETRDEQEADLSTSEGRIKRAQELIP